PRRRIGRRRECDPWHLRKAFVQYRQLPVFRAEIMSPLRNAVRLVNREQTHLNLPQQIEKTSRQQTLGRDIKQLQVTGMKPMFNLALGNGIQTGIEKGGLDTELMQGLHLIL